MPDQPNSDLLQLLIPSEEPTLILGGGKTLTLSSLLDQVPVEQALEILKVFYLRSIGDDLRMITARLSTLADQVDRISRQ